MAPITFPEYRGSGHQELYMLPAPYLVYRGDSLRVDRRGARGLLLERPRFEIDISADGAVPVSSDDGGPREGMEDLKPVFEIGPSLNWLLAEGDRGRLELRVPIRAAIATDFRSSRHVGWKAHPMLSFNASRKHVGGWNLGINLGPQFSTRQYHGYYYDVDAGDATPTRPAYRAGSGYSGTSVLISASKRWQQVWVGAFVRYDNLSGTRYADSPLVETYHAAMGGFAITWIFARSSHQVSARPYEDY